MKALNKHIIVALMVSIFLMPAAWAMADDGITVVANPYNQNKAQKWVDYLLQNEVTVKFAKPEDFESVKSSKYLAIIGGVDDEHIMNLVSQAVGGKEASAMAKKGAKKMFIKDGTWAPGQKVLIFTGSDTEAAAQARVESRESWMPYLVDWFDLDEGPTTLRAY